MTDNKQPSSLLLRGTLLAHGRYRIGQYLASGGFGNTYAATDLSFDERVAIKELFIRGICGRVADRADIAIALPENQRVFAAQQEKFRKEARRLHKLSNPHIVRVSDLFDENGTTYYVMEYVDGESLAERLNRTHAPLDEAELMRLVPQLLDALECIHNEDIWHLDLKPANIMLDANGVVRLIDFGASKQFKNDRGGHLSTSSVLAYTQGYAPTEQTEQNFDKFGPWTDFYALGATMFNLLTMRQPPSPSDIDEDPRRALHLPSHVSAKTCRLIAWLMKPGRKDRPQCADDVRRFLLQSSGGSVDVGPVADLLSPDTVTMVKPRKSRPQHDAAPTHVKTVARWLAVAAVATVGIIWAAVSLWPYDGAYDEDAAYDDPVLLFDTTTVTDSFVSIDTGPDNMRHYSYSGQWAFSLPNGMGTAHFAAYGDVPACTYTGGFADGICDDTTGNATLTFASGDQYIGTFKDGHYDIGRFICSDKSYFEGSFSDGNPYNGTWHAPNGAVDGVVVDGRDE